MPSTQNDRGVTIVQGQLPDTCIVRFADYLGANYDATFSGPNAERRADIYARFLRESTAGAMLSRQQPAPPVVLDALAAAVDAFSHDDEPSTGGLR